ncbi:MAG: thiamine pyrophosphate-binding protein, partial [Oscillospiraceae bacterium]|nr:thiamine pyrophosphate-binding protein [Oscillospiraceae bacterium]
MVDTKTFVDELKSNGFEKFAGVPCSFLSSLINEAENRGIYEAFVNEGDAAAYAAGTLLSGGKCAVLMQNSGLSNALSPLTSLNELFGLHTLLIIGNRGVDDEPQHRIMASAVKPVLDALNIPYFNAEDEGCLKKAIDCLNQ